MLKNNNPAGFGKLCQELATKGPESQTQQRFRIWLSQNYSDIRVPAKSLALSDKEVSLLLAAPSLFASSQAGNGMNGQRCGCF